MPKPFLSVIVPAYNECKNIPLTLIDIDYHLSKVEFSYEIIVVDDGSIDGTGEIVKNISRTIKNLHLVEYSENHGEGYAVRQGMLKAKGNCRFLADADNSVSINQFDSLLPLLKEGYEVIAGLYSPVCFSEAAAEKVFSLSRINKLAFGFETLLLARKLGCRIKKISVNRKNSFGIQMKFSDFIRFVFDMLRVRVWFWRDVYRLNNKQMTNNL